MSAPRPLVALALLTATAWSAAAQASGDWAPVRSREIRLEGEIVGSPVAIDGRVLVATRAGGLVGIEAAGGGVAWTHRAPGPIRDLLAAAGLAVAVGFDGALSAWDADGTSVWQAAIGAPPALTPVGSRGLILAAGDDGSLIAFSPSGGARMWASTLSSGPARGLAALDATAFVIDADARLTVRDERGGTMAGVPEDFRAAALVLDGDRLFIGRSDGRLECLDATSLKSFWRHRLGAPLAAAPCTDGRRIFAVLRSGVLFALDRRSGDSRWWRPLPSTAVFRPVLWAGAVIAAGRSSLVLAFDPATGRPLGRFDAGLVVRAQPSVVGAELWVPVYDQERDRSVLLVLKIPGGPAAGSSRSGGNPP
jgi:outer membrane protein assembly factor BamB